MTNRHSAYVVVLDHDIREDDAQVLISALRMLRGVVDVQPVVTDVSSALVANSRLKNELTRSLYHWIGTNLRIT